MHKSLYYRNSNKDKQQHQHIPRHTQAMVSKQGNRKTKLERDIGVGHQKILAEMIMHHKHLLVVRKVGAPHEIHRIKHKKQCQRVLITTRVTKANATVTKNGPHVVINRGGKVIHMDGVTNVP